MRIFLPLRSAGVRMGVLAEKDLKPLSQKANPLIPFASSLLINSLPTGPSVTVCKSA